MMTSEQRRVQEVIVRLNGDYRRDGELAIEYLSRIAASAINRCQSVHVVAGNRVFSDYEMELEMSSRYFYKELANQGFKNLLFRGIRIVQDTTLAPNYAELREN